MDDKAHPAPSDEAAALPVYRHEAEILEAMRDHRVVVIEGPTGSGKTTQVPRILLRSGMVDAVIGVTQPRRIAAVSVAWRIAEEMGVALGDEVGYAIRFDDRTSRGTMLKIMTDGILLQEARTDPEFSAYGVLMVDEAHERSLNIDFTLGLIHRALRRRDDLRVVVSSATLDPAVFQRFFADVVGPKGVPMISIQARPYPVEIGYRPPPSDDPADMIDAVADEVLGIHRTGEPGHVLVFLPGEGAIHRVTDELWRRRPGRNMSVLPLYGRLTREEQERVFEPAPAGKRKVVLATNIAETSITIPDVRYVVDSGLAKVPRVQGRTAITSLQEEGISQASADQRAGRAGRTAPGRAIRLYSRRDYQRRDRFTDEEILRLELSEVMLRLIDLGIHEVERFPFPTRPETRQLRDALERLQKLGAIDGRRKLTAIGERMVPFPLSPPLARMVIEAADRFPAVVDEVLVVAAFLSARPPFLFPPGDEVAARAAQQALAQPLGDAATAVHVLRLYGKARNPARFCEQSFLDPNVMAFIVKAHGQLTEIARSLGIEIRSGGSPSDMVRAVAAGFAPNLMMGHGRYYEGPGGGRIAIHPSSSLFGSRHRFVVAAEIVFDRRLHARFVSALRADWIPDIDPEAARRWHIRRRGDEKRGRFAEREKVPESIRVGGVTLPVQARRGRAKVDVPFEALEKLSGAEVPPAWAAWPATVVSGKRRFLSGTPLGKLLGLAALAPIPGPEESIERLGVEGALLEADRNLHTIVRELDRLLKPALPRRGRRPGWVMLVANGGGGYWFEVSPDFAEAVANTGEALRDLAETIPEGDRAMPRLRALAEKTDEKVDAVARVLAASSSGRRGRRRRRR